MIWRKLEMRVRSNQEAQQHAETPTMFDDDNGPGFHVLGGRMSLGRPCLSCGAGLDSNANFCANCGEPVPSQAPSAQRSPLIQYPYNPYTAALNPQPTQSAPQSATAPATNPPPTPIHYPPRPRLAPIPQNKPNLYGSAKGIESCLICLLKLVFCVIVGIICPPAIPVMVVLALILFFVNYWMD